MRGLSGGVLGRSARGSQLRETLAASPKKGTVSIIQMLQQQQIIEFRDLKCC